MADLAMSTRTPITPAQALNERFTRVYARYQARIAAYVQPQVRGNDHDLADDLTAEAFTRAWLSFHQCQAVTDQQLFAWLATIARHVVIDHYRIARNTREVPADTGHWAYANRDLVATDNGTYKAVTGAAPGDSDPDADELLRRARAPRTLVGAR